MTKTKLVVAAFAALTLTAGQAFAQEEGEVEGEIEGEVGVEGGVGVEAEAGVGVEGEVVPPEMGDDEIDGAAGLTTPMGKIKVTAVIGINLGEEAIAKPLAIAPDVFYGVSDKLEVGLAHSNYNLFGFMGQPGGGLCLSGEDGGCAKVYNGPTGILARFGLVDGPTQIAADAGVILASLSDPMGVGLKLGIRGRHMAGKIAIEFAPNIYVGITERDFYGELISVPVAVGFMATEQLSVGLQTGIQGPLDGFGDTFNVPLSIAGAFGINENLQVGAAITLGRVTGGCPEGFECGGAADDRSLSIFANWHN